MKKKFNINGHETDIVFNDDGLTVTKTPKNKLNQTGWLLKQINAKNITDKLLRARPNKYFIPRVLDINAMPPSVKEQRVFGKPLRDDFKKNLSAVDWDIIYSAMANFLHDMHASWPIQNNGVIFDDKFLHGLYILLQPADFMVVRDALHYFTKNYRGTDTLYFSHNDLNPDNIFYNPDTKTVSIIDFAQSEYTTLQTEFDKLKMHGFDIDKLRKLYDSLWPQNQKDMDNIFRILMSLSRYDLQTIPQQIEKLKLIFPSKANVVAAQLDR